MKNVGSPKRPQTVSPIMGQTLPKYSQLEGDEYEDLAAEEQCSVQFRANIKESFLSVPCRSIVCC